jgi:hypothetical protein
MSSRTTENSDPVPDAVAEVGESRSGFWGARRVVVVVAFVLGVGLLLVLAPGALAQSGNDVAKNLGDLLRGYAAQFYGGVIAIVSLIFLINRRYVELMSFLIAAVVVGWMVFSPDAIAKAARAIGRQVLG